jgi:hypothetical protein
MCAPTYLRQQLHIVAARHELRRDGLAETTVEQQPPGRRMTRIQRARRVLRSEHRGVDGGLHVHAPVHKLKQELEEPLIAVIRAATAKRQYTAVSQERAVPGNQVETLREVVSDCRSGRGHTLPAQDHRLGLRGRLHQGHELAPEAAHIRINDMEDEAAGDGGVEGGSPRSLCPSPPAPESCASPRRQRSCR